MDSLFKESLWEQFGAAIDFLDEALDACPDELWLAPLWLTPTARPERAQFWYVAYHTLFWLDLYLTGTEEGYLPPPPFTLIEQDGDNPMPECAYTKAELRAFLQGSRERCKATLDALTDETARRRCGFSWGELSFYELLIYNLRHVQNHSAQLNMLLGQQVGPQRDYPPRASSIRF